MIYMARPPSFSQILCCLVYHRPNVYYVRTVLTAVRIWNDRSLILHILPSANSLRTAHDRSGKKKKKKFFAVFNSSIFVSIYFTYRHLSTSVFFRSGLVFPCTRYVNVPCRHNMDGLYQMTFIFCFLVG